MNLSEYQAEARTMLEVGTAASQDEIHSAYKRAALQSHPVENPGNTSTAKTRYCQIRSAYLCLKECTLKEQNYGTTWRPSETCNDDQHEHEHQMPTFEEAEKAFNETFCKINLKPDQRTRRMRIFSAIENKLNRASSMNNINASTPAQCESLERPRPRPRTSPLGTQRFDLQRATV